MDDPDSNDANDDANGMPTGEGATVQSLVITLLPGTEPTETDESDQLEPSKVPDASSNLSVDFGFVPLVSLGSYVWYDFDGDGQQDPDENGITGAVIELLNPDGSPAVDADGMSVISQTTGTDGRYHFGNLLPGDYIVQVTPPDATYEPTDTPTDADPDTNLANDDSNGQLFGKGNIVRSPIVTLVNGEESTGEGEDDPSGLPDGHGNLTVDFGFVRPVSVGNYV